MFDVCFKANDSYSIIVIIMQGPDGPLGVKGGPGLPGNPVRKIVVIFVVLELICICTCRQFSCYIR